MNSAPSFPVRAVRRFVCLLLLSLSGLSQGAEADDTAKRTFDVAAAEAPVSLKAFIEQSGREILFPVADVRGIVTNPVRGEFAPKDALDRMLAGTPLAASRTKSGILSVRRSDDPNGAGAASRNDRPDRNSGSEKNMELPVFEVMGSKLLNMDLPRSRNDMQPYVVFDRETIQSSGALTLNDFLKDRLTMNTVAGTNAQSAISSGNISVINLRGLGAGQTVILIDGRRAPDSVRAGTPGQSNLNGIPLQAIERVEVLPSTAAGIYGGGATGGVVNVILRRDYSGAEAKLTYDNTFESDAATRRVDLNAGLTLEGGKTSVLLAASWSDQNPLAVQDRTFLQDGRAAILRNNPSQILNAAPPVGGTPNIRSADGTNLVLKSGATLNSPITFVPAGYAGPAGDGGAALVANAGRYNLGLGRTGQFAGGGLQQLIYPSDIESAMVSARRQFGDKLQGFVEVAGSHTRALLAGSPIDSSLSTNLAPTLDVNPFTRAILVSVPDGFSWTELVSDDRRIVGGALLKLPGDWQAEADYAWSRYRFHNFSPAIGTITRTAIMAGSLPVLRDTSVYPLDLAPYSTNTTLNTQHSTLRDATLRAAGPLFSVPAGPVRLASLVEYREETRGDDYQTTSFTPFTVTYYPPQKRVVKSAYLEANVPIWKKRGDAGVRGDLELQLAGRFDDYATTSRSASVTGTAPVLSASNHLRSTNPTVGARWQPTSDVSIRASYAEGFSPPTTAQLLPSPAGTGVTVIDPRRGNVSTVATNYAGGNPDLQPEDAESLSTGAILTPRFVRGLRVSLDFTRIRKTGNIATLNAQQVVDNEASLPGRVTRGAVPPNDPFGVGPITAVNFTTLNLSRAEVEAYDLAVDYEIPDLGPGKLSFFAAATWQTHYKTQVLASSPLVESVGITSSNPLKFRSNAGFTFRARRWSLAWTARYFDAYWVADPALASSAARFLTQGGRRIEHQLYHDVVASWRWDRRSPSSWGARFLNGTELMVGVRNLFNAKPPYDASNSSYFYSFFGDPRLSSYYVSLRRSF